LECVTVYSADVNVSLEPVLWLFLLLSWYLVREQMTKKLSEMWLGG
jgi:hypothetical protein